MALSVNNLDAWETNIDVQYVDVLENNVEWEHFPEWSLEDGQLTIQLDTEELPASAQRFFRVRIGMGD